MLVIGERINPSNRPQLERAIRKNDWAYIQEQAVLQERAGVQAIDINIHVPGVKPLEAMRSVVQAVRQVSQLPLAIDELAPAVVEAGLEAAGGDVLINSPIWTDQTARTRQLLSLANQYQTEILTFPMRGTQLPGSPKERVEAARRILEQFQDAGVGRDRVLVDAVLFAVKKVRAQVIETLETIKRLKEELGVRTAIGLSNVSYGLNDRPRINVRFLTLARACGVDAIICDPLQTEVMEAVRAKTKVEFNPLERKTITEFVEFSERLT